jgi:hypothetical protein
LQYIHEAQNLYDLQWQSSSPKAVTLSFWAKCSLTGTFGGSIRNSGSGGYSGYPFSYSIPTANTWTFITISVPAAVVTNGWGATNGYGMYMYFDLGTGTTYTNTAGAWVAQNVVGANGTTKMVNTSGATWQFTGVQLEVGTVATSFDFRSYGQELLLCQRYFELTASTANSWLLGTTNSVSGNEWDYVMSFLVQKRVNPTGVVVGSWAYNNTNAVSSYIANSSPVGFNYIQIATGTGRIYSYNTGGGYITWSAEL